MERKKAISRVERAIGDRSLYWFGTRGADALPIVKVEQFAGVFSQIAPLSNEHTMPGTQDVCLEPSTGRRVDLNRYSIDDDGSEQVRQFQIALSNVLAAPSCVVPYRPSRLLSASYFPRLNSCLYLGVFADLQNAFEHKPWVETELERAGVDVIDWRYFGDTNPARLHEYVEARFDRGDDVVLRTNRSDGGVGLLRLRVGEDVEKRIPPHQEGFIAAAPYLKNHYPVNLSGAVFDDETVTVRSPSLQLIGVESCSTGEFSYCGNDFAVVADALGAKALGALEAATRRVGAWLFTCGYRGGFGIDALCRGGDVVITEVNARFQGSSAASAYLAQRFGISDVYFDHIAAWLGLPGPTKELSLAEVARMQAEEGGRLAQVVCYNTTSQAERRRKPYVVPDVPFGSLRCVADEDIHVLPDAMLFKVFWKGGVTETGYSLTEDVEREIAALKERLYEVVPSAKAKAG